MINSKKQNAQIKGIFFHELLHVLEKRKGKTEKERIEALLPSRKYFGFQFYSWQEYRLLQEEAMKSLFGKIDDSTWRELGKMVIQYFKSTLIGKTLMALCVGNIIRGIGMTAGTMSTFTKGVIFTPNASNLGDLQIRIANMIEEPAYWAQIWEELAQTLGYEVHVSYIKQGERDYLFKGKAQLLPKQSKL